MIHHSIDRPATYRSVQWAGDNLAEVREVMGEWPVRDNGDGTLTMDTWPTGQRIVHTGQWFDSADNTGVADTNPALAPHRQRVRGPGPLDHTVTPAAPARPAE